MIQSAAKLSVVDGTFIAPPGYCGSSVD